MQDIENKSDAIYCISDLRFKNLSDLDCNPTIVILKSLRN